MSSRTVQLDEDAERILEDLVRDTGLSISALLQRGLLALHDQTAQEPRRTAYEIYEELDLGPGGYAIAPSTETRHGVQETLRWRRDLDIDYEENAVYRETFLQWLVGEDLATVRAYGQLQYSMALTYEGPPVDPEQRAHWHTNRLRSAAKDLRHLKNYLREFAFASLDEPVPSAEDVHWARHAKRLAKRLGTIEEEFRRTLLTRPEEE